MSNAALFARLKAAAAYAKAMDRLWRRIGIEMSRGDALAALDAWIDAGRPRWAIVPESVWDVHRIYHLEDLALEAYKLEHPTARGAKGVVFRAERLPDGRPSRRGSVACRYCGEVLVAEAVMSGYAKMASGQPYPKARDPEAAVAPGIHP